MFYFMIKTKFYADSTFVHFIVAFYLEQLLVLMQYMKIIDTN